MIGETVGNYRVTARLGAGGMGEVYRATDTRLGREVALKFSAEKFSERFEREARAVAALNHPNICTLYDVAPNYLVMELVEGVTLDERIADGPLPRDEAFGIARQIAAALEEAHDKGITHRDLKPSNIKIRPDGTVKVLDFGLAKIQAAQASAVAIELDPAHGVTLSPTITSPAAITQAGLILGTAAYMSPEQAKGKPVDRRADIWAFGVVLYEMLTGKRPFRGDDVGDVLASVIKEEPKWDDVPPQARRVLQRCLEKDQKKRLRDVSGIELLLEDVGQAAVFNAARSKPVRHWVIEGVLTAGVLLTAWLLWPSTPPERPLVRLDVYLGPNMTPASLRGTDVVISPNGDRLAFVSQGGLFVRRLDQPDAVRLAGVERAYAPFFSPSGDWIGYFSGGLKKVPVTGGSVVPLAEGNGFGGSWGDDGYIVASLDGRTLSRIPSGGGATTTLTELADGEYGHRWPQVLPGAKAVIFTARRSTGDAIRVVTIDDRRVKTVHEGGLFGRYLPGTGGSGHLLFVNGGTLFAMSFDTDRLEVRGSPVPVLESVGFSNILSAGSAQVDVSRTGTLVYRSSGPGASVSLQWVDASAKPQPLPVKPNAYTHPRLSPDGTRVALVIVSATGQDIWVYDIARDSMQPVTFGGRSNQFPVWTHDSRYIVFTDGVGGTGMSWTRADGASAPQHLTETKNGQFPWSFSPDGKRLAYAEFPGGSGDLWTMPIDYDGNGLRAGKPELFLQTPTNELYPAFSPDGRWIAYRSFESGDSEIYVRAFPNNSGGGKWMISTGGGAVPIWSPNGRELFYRTDDQRIMVVDYTQDKDTFSPGKARPWNDVRLADNNQRNLDIARDGKRFLVLFPVETPEAQALRNHVSFLQNFSDELRRRVN